MKWYIKAHDRIACLANAYPVRDVVPSQRDSRPTSLVTTKFPWPPRHSLRSGSGWQGGPTGRQVSNFGFQVSSFKFQVSSFKSIQIIVLTCLIGLFPVSRAMAGPEFTIVIRMMDIQDKWFRSEIIRKFEKLHKVNIQVAVFDKEWDVPRMLEIDAKRSRPLINLVKTPKEIMLYLKEKRLIQPYDDIVPEHELNKAMSQFDRTALDVLGLIEGQLYFIPRKLESRIMIFLKSKVLDAVSGWKAMRNDIHAALKQENGYGLPADYHLEADPSQWDTYDLFVTAYYWAHRDYYGMKMPRMAHRGKKYMGTVAGLCDKAIEMGASPDDLLHIDSTPIKDMFQWESVFRYHGLYNPGMWEESWSGGGIWGAMRDGKVFLAFMHQIDCSFIHGSAHPMMAGYLSDPDDLGFAVMPLGVSVALDQNSRPVRTGNRKALTGGWGWAIPKTAPYPKLAWKLVEFISRYENHINECRLFGMFPVRKDLLSNLKRTFPEPWMAEMLGVSLRQIQINDGLTLPPVVQWPEVGKVYLDAWYNIVVDQQVETDTDGKVNPVRKPTLTRGIKPRVLEKRINHAASHGAFSNGVNRKALETLLKQNYQPRIQKILE